jgi:hypothetical protein
VLHRDTASDRQPVDEPLIEILDSLVGVPAFEAISTGHPERMGLAYGWNIEDYLARSRTRTPGCKKGRRDAKICTVAIKITFCTCRFCLVAPISHRGRPPQ